MSVSNWLDSNSQRAYPLQEGPLPAGLALLPEQALCDAGIDLGGLSLFRTGSHGVWLYRVARDSDTLSFCLRSDAPGLVGRQLCFAVPVDAAEYTIARAEARLIGDDPSSSSSVAPGDPEAGPAAGTQECPGDFLAEGFLIVGPLAGLLETLEPGQEWIDPTGSALLEPGTLQVHDRRHTPRLLVANADRTRISAAEGCSVADAGYGPGPFLVARCLQGPLRLRSGFNASLRQSAADNSLSLGAALGAGAGTACGEVELFPGESPPADSDLLTGGPDCGDTVTAVNGIPGPYLHLRGRTGIRVDRGQPHELVVTADYNGLVVCEPAAGSSSSSSGTPPGG